MKKLLIATFMAALAVAPFAAQADDIYDGKDCRDGNAEPAAAGAASGEDADRGSVCVYNEGSVIFYIGGEAQAEEEAGTGGACGSIIIMDQNVTGDEDWDNAEQGTHCD